MRDSRYWIERLKLERHPEGGFYREIYRCDETIDIHGLPSRYDRPHSIATSIYYLLTSEHFSAFHCLKSDEIWHHYTGSPLAIYTITPDGESSKIVLNGAEGPFQAIIPRNTWFSAEVMESNSYTLAGCTVAPGFDFSDFTMGTRKNLVKQYPQHQTLIERFTM